MSAAPGVAFERLGGGGAAWSATELLSAVRPRERAHAARPHVLVNMISTLDGHAAIGGRTKEMGGPADLEMLLELRVLVDAVLVGSGTLRAEGYGRLMRRPERRARRVAAAAAADPLAVIVSRKLDLPWEAPLFEAAEQPILVYTSSAAGAPATPAPVELVRLETLAPAAVLADLRRREVRALLCEGGPTLNRLLLAAGAVDELFLTLSPLITADASEPGIVAGPALPALQRARLVWALRHDSELFLRYSFTS